MKTKSNIGLAEMAEACELAGVIAARDKNVPIERARALNAAAATLREIERGEWVRMEIHPIAGGTTVSASAVCNCGAHRRGELTGGWQCPIHGLQL